MLEERPMVASSPARVRKRAPKLVLRALSLVLTLLLLASSLGQVAHFVLVPHAICSEHGELLELTPAAVSGASRQATSDDGGAGFTSPEGLASHDHCEVWLRAPREQLVPPRPALLLPARVTLARTELDCVAMDVAATCAPLLVAPKTSPPRSARA